MKTFEAYEKGSLRTQKMSFHASINPSVTDRIPEDRMSEFIRDYMDKMGYGDQPYIVYKHTDTGRDHWHICSTRVDENGHKIPDFQERKRSQQAMKELMAKYDFQIGKGTKEKKQSGDFNPYSGFDKKAGEFQTQLEKIAALAMQYHFKEDRHFDIVMRSFNVEVVHRPDGTTALIGLDPKSGKHVTEPITSKNIPTLDQIRDHIEQCKKNSVKTREKQRVTNITAAGLKRRCFTCAAISPRAESIWNFQSQKMEKSSVSHWWTIIRNAFSRPASWTASKPPSLRLFDRQNGAKNRKRMPRKRIKGPMTSTT